MEGSKQEREEGLALFQYMKTQQRNNFLNYSKDDIEEIKYDDGLSTFRISATTPTRKGGGLLVLDTEKSDYDWLLTPPGTPLFPSLDQDTAIVNLSQRRVLMRSASASKSSKLSYAQDPPSKALSGNPSPHRPSTVSSTSCTTSTNKARPSSPALARSRPTIRPSSPCRPITPTGKSSATASRSATRSSTPTLCHNNTPPSSASRTGCSNGRSQGRSVSPKLCPWEPMMSVFSTEPPPNLRTSPSNRSIQRSRSEGSRHGVTAQANGSYLKAVSDCNPPQWHSMSPDITGSCNSSNSLEQNSSHTSKDSVVSSCDDSMDIVDLVVPGNRRKTLNNVSKATKTPSRLENSSSGRSILPAKRQTRPAMSSRDMISSLANRRLFERQVPQRRNLQNMFRPLMSSVPASSFYSIGGDDMHPDPTNPSAVPSITMNGRQEHGVKILPGSRCNHQGVECKECQNICACAMCLGKSGDRLTNNDGDLHQCHDFGSKEIESNDIEIKISKEEETKEEHMQIEDEPGEAKGLLDAWNGNHTFIVGDGHAQNHQRIAVSHKCANVRDLNVDSDVDMKDLNSLGQGGIREQPNQELLMHLYSGESQMQDVSFSREQLIVHYIEDNNMIATMKSSSCSKHRCNRGSSEPTFESSSIQTDKNYSSVGSQHGATQRASTDLHSFRRQLSLKDTNIKFQDGMVNTKRTESCDISTSDSYSCSGSLESSFVDNHTEKFGKNAPQVLCHEVDATSHTEHLLADTAVINQISCDILSAKKSATYLETHPVIEKDKMLNDMSMGNESDIMETNNFLINCGEEDPTKQAAKQRPALMMIDVPKASSGGFEEQPAVDVDDTPGMEDALSIVGGCPMKMMESKQETDQKFNMDLGMTINHASDMETMHLGLKLAAGNEAGAEHSRNSTFDEAVVEERRSFDDKLKRVQPLKRNVTLEEATDTVLFCSSIMHEIVYTAATLAIKEEEKSAVKPLASEEFASLFGLSGAEYKSMTPQRGSRAAVRNRQRTSLPVQRTVNHVQKLRMVHQQTPSLAMRESLVDRIENAVIGNNEEELLATRATEKVHQKRKDVRAKKAKCRCGCCVM